MPPKKIGEGAQARYNEKKPTIAFRAPSGTFKRRIHAEAEKAGMTVPEYLMAAIEHYMETGGMDTTPKPNKAKDSPPDLPTEKPMGMPKWDKINETYDEYTARHNEWLDQQKG